VKPLISASAYGTERRSDGIAHGPLMIQEYLPEIETDGEWSLMYFHGVFSHAVRKRARSGDFRVQSDFGGTTEIATPPRKFLKIAHEALELLPSRPVFARVDMVERGSSPLLMELELIEPELFLTLADHAAHGLALAIEAAI
jgi:glutathione synthase/RimK-type ligase-like ATP-grasp enzyme